MTTILRTSSHGRQQDVGQAMDGTGTGPKPGRIWRLSAHGNEVGTFTDLRNRRFVPGERLLDDQGNRRLVIVVTDEKALCMEVSRPI